ncbi:MAG: hypothetical protein B6D44_16290 [Ignavibacteriales bacterium UTCHB2]|nr:MAG: hypothetical protein B6D44_16290 [Ignavibacteriales bacterium UTCHB2]
MTQPLISRIDRKIDKYFLSYLLFIWSLYIIDVSPSFFLISTGIIATVLFVWIVVIEYENNRIKITPILVLVIFPILMLGISSIYHGLDYLDIDYASLGPLYLSTKSIVVGYLMVATGLFFQLLGMQFFRPTLNRSVSEPKIKTNHVRIFRFFLIFFILAQLGTQYLALGIVQNLLNTIPLAILIYISIMDRVNSLTSYNYKRNSVFIGAGILFIANLILLSKTVLVLNIVPIFLFYLVQSKGINKYKPIILMVMAALLYFLFIQPLVSNARLLLLKQNKEPTADFISEYIVTGEYKYPIYIGSGSKNAVEAFLSRAFELNAPGYIYELTLRSGYQDGSTFSNIAIGLIPRIFWSDKPSIPQGARFSSEILGFEKVSIGMLIAGELFWNFGFHGVIIGSLLIGLALGYVWKQINPFALNNFYYFTFYFYLLQSCIGGSEFSAVFLGALQLIIFFFFIRFYDLFRKK